MHVYIYICALEGIFGKISWFHQDLLLVMGISWVSDGY